MNFALPPPPSLFFFQAVFWRSIKTWPPSKMAAVKLWMLKSSTKAAATQFTTVPSIITLQVLPASAGKLTQYSTESCDPPPLKPICCLFVSQIWPANQEASDPHNRKCFVPQPGLPSVQLQDLLQTGSRWERLVAHLCLQCRWEHHGGPARPEDLLRDVLHKHHIPLQQGGQRLHRLWRSVCHRHQRHQSHVCVWPAERKAG